MRKLIWPDRSFAPRSLSSAFTLTCFYFPPTKITEPDCHPQSATIFFHPQWALHPSVPTPFLSVECAP